MKKILCCFCGEIIPETESNNPAPADNTPGARCCLDCNDTIVIPAKILINELISNHINALAAKKRKAMVMMQ